MVRRLGDEAADARFDCYAKTARRARFLAEMERMLRLYFLQQWFNPSDPAWRKHSTIRKRCAVSSASASARVGPGRDDGGRFRHLLETHELGQRLFDEVQRHLAEKGLKIATGTIVEPNLA
jgi:IS5 family transposase